MENSILFSGVQQLNFSGGMSAAENATSTLHCQLQEVLLFYITMGGFLVGVGWLLFILMMVKGVCGSLHKYLHYTFVFILAVLIVGLLLSLNALFVLSIGAAINMFPVTQAEYCNHVIYYWALVEVVITLIVNALFSVVFLLYCVGVLCCCLLVWTDK